MCYLYTTHSIESKICYNFFMNAMSKDFFLASKYVVVMSLMFTLSMPVVVLSQEDTATTTSESITPVESITATTTLPTATTTNEFPPTLTEEKTATNTGEVLGESAILQVEEMTEENVEEGLVQSIIEIFTPPPPVLSKRVLKKRVVIDSRALHSCEAETFRIDITSKSSARARIAFQRDSDAPYEIEIGGLPQGIDIRFSKNSTYRYSQGASDRSFELVITNQQGSQKGNFSVPIIYTQKGGKDSSVVCQINIINL